MAERRCLPKDGVLSLAQAKADCRLVLHASFSIDWLLGVCSAWPVPKLWGWQADKLNQRPLALTHALSSVPCISY